MLPCLQLYKIWPHHTDSRPSTQAPDHNAVKMLDSCTAKPDVPGKPVLPIYGVLMLTFPEIDPVIFSIGGFGIRWYSMAYIVGLIAAWRIIIRLNAAPRPGFASVATKDQIDDLLTWMILGVVIGGRFGYVFFYGFERFLADPLWLFKAWEGGMSFHGGFLGVVVATWWFCRRNQLDLWRLSDQIALVAPIGLFLGRCANFINGELFGRVAHDVPWAMVFPNGGPDPRHPSQLYEAGLEGLVLGLVLIIAWKRQQSANPGGGLVGIFLAGYGASRFIVEFFREPDAHLGLLGLGLTMGQWLSTPMILLGIWLAFKPPGKPASSKPVKA